MAAIFISYRRSEAAAHAGRLYDRLVECFGASEVFYDAASIESGDHFPQRLSDGINGARVLLVLIGCTWLSELNRRANEPDIDFVRTEVQLGLVRRLCANAPSIIPVLLQGTDTPKLTELHALLRAEIGPLLDFHAHSLRDGSEWSNQLGPLLERIERVSGISRVDRKCKVLDQLPAMPPYFGGRQSDLQRVLSYLSKSEAGSVVSVTIRGIGGIGKTSLAIAAGHALKGVYPDGQLFFQLGSNSESPISGATARLRWLRLMDPNTKLPTDDSSLAACYRKRLAGSAVLVVVDDPTNADDIRALEPPVGGAMLITSRRILSGRPSISLDALDSGAAGELLSNLCERLANEPRRAELAEACARLPIALQAAGRYLARRPSKPLDEYLTDLTENRLTSFSKAAAEDVTLNVEAVLAHSLRALSPIECQALKGLSVISADFDRAFGQSVAMCNGDTLDALVELSLLEYRVDQERYRLHDLIRELARRDISLAEDKAALHRYAQSAITVMKRVRETGSAEGQLKALTLYDQEGVHVDAAFHILCSDKDYDEDFCELLEKSVTLIALRRPSDELLQIFNYGLEAARRHGNRRREGRYLSHLGRTLSRCGKPRQAMSHYEEALPISLELEDEVGQAVLVGNLGNCLFDLGQTHDSIEKFQESLAITRRIGDRSGEGIRLSNLGRALKKLGLRFRAIMQYRRALKISCELGERDRESERLRCLGEFFTSQRGIDLIKQAITISQQLKDRQSEGIHLGSLGNLYIEAGNPAEGMRRLEDGLQIAREVRDVLGEGNRLRDLAKAHERMGTINKAIDYSEQALAIFNTLEVAEGNQIRLDLARLRAVGLVGADEDQVR